jgi:hypothetical protein
MAQGDVVCFDQFLVNLGKGPDVGHDFGSTPNNLKCAIIDSTTPLTALIANPHWSANGTDLSANEVTVAGDYALGGNLLSAASCTLTGNRAEFDFGDPAPWTTGTDTDARWGVVYDDIATNKPCICFVDLGSSFDMSTGTLTITFGTPAFYIDQAP